MKKIAAVSLILSALCAPGAFAAAIIEPVMATIPAGQFVMGNPAPSPAVMGSPSDGPAHKVSIKTFKLSKYELTVKEFRQFVDAAKYVPVGIGERRDGCWKWVKPGDGPAPGMRIAPSPGKWDTPAYAPSDYHPVMCVSMEDGLAYTKWLSAQTGKKYRLPSEAEWEYTARAGAAGSFPASGNAADTCRFGNSFDKSGKVAFLRDLGWERKDGDCDDLAEYTTVVGMYEPNAFGVHDMTGNVAEYVEDCQHANYEGAPTDGTAWVANCDAKAENMVIRRGEAMATGATRCTLPSARTRAATTTAASATVFVLFSRSTAMPTCEPRAIPSRRNWPRRNRLNGHGARKCWRCVRPRKRRNRL